MWLTRSGADLLMQFSCSQTLLAAVHQHAAESAIVQCMCVALVVAQHVKLYQLRLLDDRLAAHLDGVAVPGDVGWKVCGATLLTPGVGQVLTADTRAISSTKAREGARVELSCSICRCHEYGACYDVPGNRQSVSARDENISSVRFAYLS
jgi:hypothetical protein